MRLLLDANISHKLAEHLSDLFPESAHVTDVGLTLASDRDVWEFAIERGLVLVSKDEDFRQMAFLEGPPPKVVWLRLGNCTTSEVAQAIRQGAEQIRSFVVDDDAALLILGNAGRA